MTPTEVRNAITSRFLIEYNTQFHIAVDNQIFEVPNPAVKYARVVVKFNTGNQHTLGQKGNRKFVKQGLLFVQILTPINTGTNENDTLAQSTLELFDGETLGKLWFYNGRIETERSDGVYYSQNVVVEFEFEDIR